MLMKIEREIESILLITQRGKKQDKIQVSEVHHQKIFNRLLINSHLKVANSLSFIDKP
jgi:hypothetical protein